MKSIVFPLCHKLQLKFALFRIFYILKRKIAGNFALKFSYCHGLTCVQKLFQHEL